jgi:hypothetical protein
MAHKRTLKHKHKQLPSEVEQIDQFIKRAVDAIENGEIKVTVGDWLRMLKRRDKLFPVKPVPASCKWVDSW